MKNYEFIISNSELVVWSNGTNGVKASYLITCDIAIRAVLTNKYGFKFEQVKFVKAFDLPMKPVVSRMGDSLVVFNVNGNFEWCRNNPLFSFVLPSINTNLEGNLKKINVV